MKLTTSYISMSVMKIYFVNLINYFIYFNVYFVNYCRFPNLTFKTSVNYVYFVNFDIPVVDLIIDNK